MDILKPKATTEQNFMLMMHDRIVELEKLVDKQAKEIDSLKMKNMPICYDILKNDFTNKASIKWDVRKPIDQSNVIFYNCGRALPMDDNYLNAFVIISDETFDGGETISFHLPLSLFGNDKRIHKIDFVLSDLTVKKLLEAIYEFYHSKVTEDDLNKEGYEDYRSKLYKNPNMTWIDLISLNGDGEIDEMFKEVHFGGGDAERRTERYIHTSTIIHVSIF